MKKIFVITILVAFFASICFQLSASQPGKSPSKKATTKSTALVPAKKATTPGSNIFDDIFGPLQSGGFGGTSSVYSSNELTALQASEKTLKEEMGGVGTVTTTDTSVPGVTIIATVSRHSFPNGRSSSMQLSRGVSRDSKKAKKDLPQIVVADKSVSGELSMATSSHVGPKIAPKKSWIPRWLQISALAALLVPLGYYIFKK